MKSKSKGLKKTVTDKNASLEHVLKQNEKIKETVKQSAIELTEVNEVLKQEKGTEVPVQIIKKVITQNKEVEYKVAKAADDLHQVNAELAHEMAERVVIESELADIKTDLADVRDDLSKSRAKEEETRKFALQDALTGLPNRVFFEQSLNNGLIQAKRHGGGLAVLFIDIDKFKSINDTYGHLVGDVVIRTIGEILASSMRITDSSFRNGGDEFAVILMGTELDSARLVAEKLRKKIVGTPIPADEAVIHITVSMGVVCSTEADTVIQLIRIADDRLYQSKRSGRNQIR